VSAVELVATLALAVLGVVALAPSAMRLHGRARASAAARLLAQQLHGLRWASVAASCGAGALFTRDVTGRWSWVVVTDGNGNGVRLSEVRSGVDPRRSGPHDLGSESGGAQLGFPGSGPFANIPPASGVIQRLDDPVKFGSSDLVAFTPLGTSSTGTLYVTDGRHALFAVVLYGRSGRVRVWRWDDTEGRWTM
jgi:hypothetical protein